MADTKTLPAMLKSAPVKARFYELLDKKAPNFIQTILTLYNGSDQLKKCDPVSILTAAGMAATLDLSISPSIGEAYIVPFGGKATFQIGVRGLVQLAHRSGKFIALHSGVVREGEIRGVDCVTGALVRGEKISDEIVGYVAYMKLNNGFEKAVYMTKQEMEQHARNFSQTYKYQKDKSLWGKYFDKMGCKTILKLLLTKWGITTSGLTEALVNDQKEIAPHALDVVSEQPVETIEEVVTEDTTPELVDDETGEVITEGNKLF